MAHTPSDPVDRSADRHTGRSGRADPTAGHAQDGVADGTPTRRHNAGALDIRNIISGLLGAYGVILTLTGIFGDEALPKTGGVNANLWAGLVLLVVGIAFIVWARLRPVLVPESTAVHGD
jgi:LPXTG-motif cell wall-anchored protein